MASNVGVSHNDAWALRVIQFIVLVGKVQDPPIVERISINSTQLEVARSFSYVSLFSVSYLVYGDTGTYSCSYSNATSDDDAIASAFIYVYVSGMCCTMSFHLHLFVFFFGGGGGRGNGCQRASLQLNVTWCLRLFVFAARRSYSF